jgi:exopolysaccharide biosynthesis protein
MEYIRVPFLIMKKAKVYKVMLFLLLTGSASSLSAQITGFSRIKWDREKVVPGLIWKSSHTLLNDSVPQNINVLKVNLKKRKIAISYDPLQNTLVSKQASETDAIAAVNGSFFDMKNGGSVTYIRTAGRIADKDTAKKWSRNSNINGAVMIRSGTRVFIEKAMPNSWYDAHTEYEDVLLTGPLMIKGRNKLPLPETSLSINRHPRTAIGIRNNRKVILLTLDGRTNEAFGMTIGELADLMKLIRCRDAVNLDGGGSTTMWINGKTFNGIVNMPCDNRKFDHEGERALSDIIIIR